MKRIKRKLMIISLIIVLLLVSFVAFTQQQKFGKLPSGERLERIKKSPNYRNGEFQNLSVTPMMAEDASYWKVMKAFLFNKNKRRKPNSILPSIKTNLLTLNKDSTVLVWFGHSSYFMQIDGKTFLVDPVLSGNASPVKFTTKSFNGSDIYTPNDFPMIDYLFISHDHWDHLDYETVMKLKPKIRHIITGLGVGAHLEHWGFDSKIILEKDWYEAVLLDSGFQVTVTPARHFSGRLFKRNQSLWASFVLKTPSLKIFLGGDGGYDKHFAEIGNQFGPFDLAILECGQYNQSWRYIHCLPEEVAKAAKDLQTKRLMPVHWSKFELALHDWDEPIIRISKLCKEQNIPLLTPMIGESLNLNAPAQTVNWWEEIK